MFLYWYSVNVTLGRYIISSGSRSAKWMYWVPIINAFDENSWKSFKTCWFLFLLSKIRACNLWNGGGKKFIEKKKPLSSLKQSTIFYYSEKLKWVLVSSCMHSYHFMNKVDPQNTSAKGNSWAYGKGKKRWWEKNSSYKWKKSKAKPLSY